MELDIVCPMLQRRSVANYSNTASMAEIRIFNQVHGLALSFTDICVSGGSFTCMCRMYICRMYMCRMYLCRMYLCTCGGLEVHVYTSFPVRTKDTLSGGNYLSVINILMQLRKVRREGRKGEREGGRTLEWTAA